MRGTAGWMGMILLSVEASDLLVPLARHHLHPREQVHRLDICDAKPPPCS